MYKLLACATCGSSFFFLATQNTQNKHTAAMKAAAVREMAATCNPDRPVDATPNLACLDDASTASEAGEIVALALFDFGLAVGAPLSTGPSLTLVNVGSSDKLRDLVSAIETLSDHGRLNGAVCVKLPRFLTEGVASRDLDDDGSRSLSIV